MQLLGFVNPVGRYPALVIPAWVDSADQVFGVFSPSINAPGVDRELRLISRSGIHPLPQDWSDSTTEGLDPTDVCLIALDPDHLLAYPAAAEHETLSALLEDRSFAGDHPFTRLAFAKLSGSIHLVVAELLSAASHLLTQEVASQGGAGRARLETWLEQERASISEQLGGSPSVQRFLAELPRTLEELGELTWWRGHLSLQPPRQFWTLPEIEDRQPSPQQVAILNIEPRVPDSRMLEIMGRHFLAGTNYLFFHSPSASAEALNALCSATGRAVEDAKRRATGPLGTLTAPRVGSVEFFELHREWTGSPFVFYEEAAEDGVRVVGYRGVEVGAAIASSYEQLPDYFAFELLEALTAGAPTVHNFTHAAHPEVRHGASHLSLVGTKKGGT